MDNKLSELSNPVAWLAIYHGDVYDDEISITRSVVEAQAERFGWESALTEITPLYSQEYVSALLAELEAKDEVLREIAFRVSAGGYNADSVDAEVFKQKIIDGIDSISGVLIKRIAELEGQLQSGFTPEALAQEERAENAEQRVAELEARLVVEIEPPPVIYPGRYDCHAMHSAIRRAGFRVAGDSEHVGDVDMRDERALAAVSDKQRIAELEAHNECLLKKNADLTLQRLCCINRILGEHPCR